MTKGVGLLADWISDLSLQQQAVLVLALRGPDGFPKQHPSKEVLYHYRASVIKAAHRGRMLRPNERCGSLLSLQNFVSDLVWNQMLQNFRFVEDELPLHYYTHLMHGAQVLAYKHPGALYRARWLHFYFNCCEYLHTPLESMNAMDGRLSDFGRPLDFINEEFSIMKISERILRGAEKGEYIGVDFDGTMFTYDKWVGWNVFGEPIKPMIERVQAWLVAKVPVRIVTARLGLPWARSETGQYLYSGKLINKCLVTGATYSDRMMIDAIQHHLVLHKLPRLPVQCFKDVGLMELWDDRAVQVIANTGRTLAEEHAAELAAQRGKQFLGASALDEFDPECIPGN